MFLARKPFWAPAFNEARRRRLRKLRDKSEFDPTADPFQIHDTLGLSR